MVWPDKGGRRGGKLHIEWILRSDVGFMVNRHKIVSCNCCRNHIIWYQGTRFETMTRKSRVFIVSILKCRFQNYYFVVLVLIFLNFLLFLNNTNQNFDFVFPSQFPSAPQLSLHSSPSSPKRVPSSVGSPRSFSFHPGLEKCASK